MNCQNCGAENEPGARFCAECGTPLEDLRGATQPLEDDDYTILSTASQLAEEAKTVSVTQDEVAGEGEVETDIPYEEDEPTIISSEPGLAPAPPPPPESPPPAGESSSDGGFMSQRNIIIIAVVVLLVLCCCCFFIVLGVVLGSGNIEQMFPELNNLGLLAPHRYFG